MTIDEAFDFLSRHGNVIYKVEELQKLKPTVDQLKTAVGVAARTIGNNKLAWEAGKLVAEFHEIELSCKHEEFDARVEVTRLKDSQRFTSDIKINCRQCGVPMVFLGFPVGCHVEKPMTNVDRTELRAPIHPKGEAIPPLPEGIPIGFTVHPSIMGRISGKDRPV